MAGDEESLKEVEDLPPGFYEEVRFWSGQLISWALYFVVSVIYLPWALAVHLVILAGAFLFFPTFCWRLGRQVFLYTYVLLVIMPGRFIWHELFRRNRRRGHVHDFEMDKPRAIPAKLRRRLSMVEGANPQKASDFFQKLPAEVRKQIYIHAFQGDAAWLSVLDDKPNAAVYKKPAERKYRNRAYPSVLSQDDYDHFAGFGHLSELARHPRVLLKDDHLASALALLRCCRLTYVEGIDLFYQVHTFSFNTLANPPFFLHCALPQRLACIRSIKIVWEHGKITDSQGNPDSQGFLSCTSGRYVHRLGQCHFCNPLQWLRAIQTQMTGLRHIELLIFLSPRNVGPSMGDPWLAKFFDLQFGPDHLREIDIRVLGGFEPYWTISLDDAEADERINKARTLEAQLSEHISASKEHFLDFVKSRRLQEREMTSSAIAVEVPRPENVHLAHM